MHGEGVCNIMEEWRWKEGVIAAICCSTKNKFVVTHIVVSHKLNRY